MISYNGEEFNPIGSKIGSITLAVSENGQKGIFDGNKLLCGLFDKDDRIGMFFDEVNNLWLQVTGSGGATETILLKAVAEPM